MIGVFDAQVSDTHPKMSLANSVVLPTPVNAVEHGEFIRELNLEAFTEFSCAVTIKRVSYPLEHKPSYA